MLVLSLIVTIILNYISLLRAKNLNPSRIDYRSCMGFLLLFLDNKKNYRLTNVLMYIIRREKLKYFYSLKYIKIILFIFTQIKIKFK